MDNELKLKALREAIDVGFTAIDEGRYITLKTPEDIAAFMDSVSATRSKKDKE